MAVTVRRVSRLRFSDLVELDGFTFFDRSIVPTIAAADDDTVHVIEDSDRIDLLSQMYYGTPDLWWVIARANSLRLIPRDLKTGNELIIPSKARVFSKILPKKRK
jgi:nucleoid-associated protein YgaU